MGLTMDNMIFVVMVQRGGIYSTDVAFKTMKAAEAYIYAKNHETDTDGFRYLKKHFYKINNDPRAKKIALKTQTGNRW